MREKLSQQKKASDEPSFSAVTRAPVYDLYYFLKHLLHSGDRREAVRVARLSESEVRERAARQAIVAVIDVETGEVRSG